MRLGRLAAASIVILLCASVAAFADDREEIYSNEVADELDTRSPEDFSDEQLMSYVDAEAEIASIRLRHANDIASQGGDTASEAQAEMAATIEAHGLTVREYREIAHLVRTDGDTSKRVKRIKASR